MTKILVTGADGFIGSHLTEALVRLGHEVRAFTLYNSFGSTGWLDGCGLDVAGQFEVFSGDIRDSYGVRSAVKGCDIVCHLASLIGIPYSYYSPESYIDTNVRGTLNVLQAARDFELQRVIHTSTSEVYGTAQFVPITEEHPLRGQSPYSASKIAADQIAYSFFSSFNTPVVTVRPFNTYGPRQSLRAVIPTIITQLLKGDELLRLGGTNTTRDFSHVSDTVDGFIAATFHSSGEGEVFNLGSGFEISILETADLIGRLLGRTPRLYYDKKRSRPSGSEVERLFSCNLKALETFNWRPRYSGRAGFESGLSDTIEWFSIAENLKRYQMGAYQI